MMGDLEQSLTSEQSKQPKVTRVSRTTLDPSNSTAAKSESDVPKTTWQRFREWWTWYKVLEIFLGIGVIILCIIAGYDMMVIYEINEDFIQFNAGSGPYLTNLLGDSLINHPWHWFNLPKKINFFLNEQMTFGNYGEDGETISEIAARVDTAIYNPTPDCLILFWDSDCSNINEYVKTVQQTYDLRQNYVHNLTYVINATLTAGVKYMAVAGPGFLGEGQWLLAHDFWHKVDMLNQYREMNEEVCADWNVPYINVRHEFLKDLPWYWGFNQWYLTREGEHENARGTRHVARLFGTALQGWLSGYNASSLTAPAIEPKATVKGEKIKDELGKRKQGVMMF